MATPVIMPRQGQSVESCIITKWHKNVGDKISVADKLFTYETDKATFDEEASADGVMLAVFFEEGDDVECLTNVCVIGEQGEDVRGFAPDGASDSGSSDTVSAVAEAVSDGVAANVSANVPAGVVNVATAAYAATYVKPQELSGGRMKISPRARELAQRSGAMLEYAVATGPGGRIIERDIQTLIAGGKRLTPGAMAIGGSYSDAVGTGIGGRITAADAQTGGARVDDLVATTTAASEWEIVPLSAIRKIISKTMHVSLANTAQLTLNTSFDASDIMAFRKKAKAAAEGFGLPVASVTDIIVYTVARTLANHKSLNAHFLEDNTMKIFRDVHIGVAVDTPRGLLVPTIFGASNMSLSQISAEAKSLYAMCAQGTISPDLIQGASFTISNLGAMGIESFTPILNPPQTGLLGVCSTIERTKSGVAYPAMGLSLTFDHRALDGADAARFLQDLVRCLENFSVYAALV